MKFIRKLADEGLSKVGHHGPAAAMGVPRSQLPLWDDIQFVVGQLHKLPLLDEEPRCGAHDTRCAFIHPNYLGGVLAELVEDPT